MVLEKIYKDFNTIIGNKEYVSTINEVKDICVDFYDEDDLNDIKRNIASEKYDEFIKLKEEYVLHKKKEDLIYARENNLSPEEKSKIFRAYFDKDSELRNSIEEIIKYSLSIKYKDKKGIFFNIDYSDNKGSINAFIEHSNILKKVTINKQSKH
jgi:hypothetical protein